MLSKVSLLVLGIVKERAINAYEIIKLLKVFRVAYWLPVGESTIYVTIKKLSKKGYIVGKTTRSNNMPEKTIYAITEKGIEVFERSLESYLLDSSTDMQIFNLGSIFMCHFSKEKVIELLKKKDQGLKEYSEFLSNRLKYLREGQLLSVPATTTLKHNINIIKAERSNITDLINAIKEDKYWNHFIIQCLDYDVGD